MFRFCDDGLMQQEAVLRPFSGKAIAIVLAVLALGIIAAGTVQLGVAGIAPHLGVPVLIAYIGWFAFWAPVVRVSPGEVVLDNPFRQIHVQWTQIQFIDTKWALEIHTSSGRYTAWAASAPGRHTVMSQSKAELKHLPSEALEQGTIRPGDIPTSDSGAAATTIRRQWEALRAAGHLDNPRPESDKPGIRIRWARIGVLVVIVVWAFVSVML